MSFLQLCHEMADIKLIIRGQFFSLREYLNYISIITGEHSGLVVKHQTLNLEVLDLILVGVTWLSP